jgi:hypothetical protein
MAKVRDQFRRKLLEHRLAKQASAENREIATRIGVGVIEIKRYLLSHKVDKTPMSYDALYSLFGDLDSGKMEKVVNISTRNVWQITPKTNTEE